VQKSEELHESSTDLYSDTSCAVVSLARTSNDWSDRTAPQLRPLQLLAYTYIYTTDFITMHTATWFVGWAYFRVINDPLQ